MKVLFVRERTHKLDVMENAVLKTFSQCEDIVTFCIFEDTSHYVSKLPMRADGV